ncbi:hypothetical protein M9H77_36458 [Catharanthus roseus]|uniref:Uncharacterized protein n=1 Tax=Catharanthus roseus TaxID=4058 RepID=A0ACB9ZTT8_CATRO|nr:hypothetical protein M9H77_36458 [Catharanthus roseus]
MGAAWAMSRAPELLSIGRDIMVSEHTYQPDQLELSATPCVRNIVCAKTLKGDPHCVDSPKAVENEKGALEAKLKPIKKKTKGKGLIGAWDQDSSESEGEEKVSVCFMALESQVQCSPSNFSSFIDYDDPNSMLIEMYDELKKISKKNKEFKNKIDDLLNKNSKLSSENKTLLESLEVLKNKKDFSNKEFQKLVLENKNLCEKVLSLEKYMVDYNDLKNDLTMCIEKFTKRKENFEKLLGSQRSPFDKNGEKLMKKEEVAKVEEVEREKVKEATNFEEWTRKRRKIAPEYKVDLSDIEVNELYNLEMIYEFYANLHKGRAQKQGNITYQWVTSRAGSKGIYFDYRM